MSQSNGSQNIRTNSEATTTRGGRESRKDPQSQASQIEKSVTHLLVATKQLLETLTQWSRGAATENEVSDVYVRLGYEFNIACRSFSSVGIETSDLGPVPDTLRSILEETLSQEASQASLDRYLPRIRDIIINLLHGLKRKQQKLRQKTGREGSGSNGVSGDRRQSSVNSSSDGVAAALESSTRQSMAGPAASRSMSAELEDPSIQAFPRSASTNTGRTSPSRYGRDSSEHQRTGSGRGRDGLGSNSTVSATSSLKDPVANAPVLEPPNVEPPTPYPPDDNFPSGIISTEYPQPHTKPRPEQTLAPPQPRQPDALTQLQRGGELERRASRRFSAYQISKQLGPSSVQMPMPPPQRSPVPNRGREFRESMQAVKARGSVAQRSRGKNVPTPDDISPNRMLQARNEAATGGLPTPILERPATPPQEPGSPVSKTPEGMYGAATAEKDKDNIKNRMSAVVTGPPGDDYPAFEVDELEKTVIEPVVDRSAPVTEPAPIATPSSEEIANRPTSIVNKPLTLFLQYKTRVKKFVLTEGYQNLTIARLQLAFIEKFAWNTHNNGVDLPEIYLQDQTSGVRYELEDLNDIKDSSVLVLNVNEFDEMKRHFDDGFAGVRHAIDSVKSAVDDQSSSFRRVNESQQETAKDIARLASAPPPVISSVSSTQSGSSGSAMRLAPGTRDVHLRKIDTLRRDLAVMRQTWSSYIEEMERTAENVKQKAGAIKPLVVSASAPDPSDMTASRAYVDAGKKQLGTDSEKIVNRVDDLQDIVEDLRKDVVTRGVRPLPRQLETVNRDIANATTELRKLKDYMKREKPLWTKVGEAELDAVCDDQNVLRNTEDLLADLEDDLEKAAVTFTLVEQATKQQMQQQDKALTIGGQAALRSTSRTLQDKLDANLASDPHKAKDGVLGEVRALQPNHESRLEAIERAEKARRLELEERRDGAFKKELGSFVGENRLRKTGGIEEAERQRIQKEERARREVWERMNGVILDDGAEGLSGDEDGAEENGEGVDNAGEHGDREGQQMDGAGSTFLDVQKPEDGTITPDSEFVEAREGFGEPSPLP